MSDRADDVMQDDLIDEPLRLLNEYEFCLGTLSTTIRIRLYKHLRSGKVVFKQSHFLKTPDQDAGYRTSVTFGEDEADALHLAKDTLTKYYRQALNAGRRPQENWLVANPDFA
jgi:hypothetical protein